jgi:hypothetical protein
MVSIIVHLHFSSIVVKESPHLAIFVDLIALDSRVPQTAIVLVKNVVILIKTNVNQKGSVM